MPLINFSGLASGIDSEALIDATIEARRATRVVPKEEEIAELEATNAAFEELRTLTTELRDLLLDFTDLRGGGIQKSVTSSDETAVTAVASNSASNGTYTITAISQLATNHTYTFTENIPDPSAAIMGAGEEGQLDITIGSESFSVSVDEDTTFNDLASSINSQTDSATAQLINTAAPGQTEAYRLVITSNSVGEEDGLLTIDTTTDVNGAPNLNTYLDSAAADLVDEEAQNAIFTIAGIGAITRSSNTINDVIPGVTISLEDDNISSNVTIQVQNDTSATESAVTEFIDKYNEIVEYVNENDTITREESGAEIETIFGPLASTRIDDGLLSAIRSTIVGSRHLSPDEDNPTNRYRIFADLGIATERDGTLSIDSDEFQEALAGEPDSVDNILQNFANETAKTGKLFEQYLRFNGGGAGGGLFQGATKNNEERIESLNDEIARAEEFIDNEANQIRARFARLEATISRLQNQQAALTSALAGLNA